MGIVLKQSFTNTIVIFIGFLIGGVNVLFLFTHFLQEDYFGLTTFLLSSANILMPLLVLGMQHTVIKFFSKYQSAKEKDAFLTSTLFLPLIVIIPLSLIGILVYEQLSNWLSSKNILIKDYTYLIFITAIFMGYFEVFYAWAKVQFNSVFGNFIKEVFARISTSILLLLVFFGVLTNQQFIYAVVIVYGIRMLLMLCYSLSLYTPKFTFKLPFNSKEIISFSLYIIVAGSAAGILLEIDKFMIPKLMDIAEVAYYSVGVYIASVIAIPTRAMQQITSPITANDMNSNNLFEVQSLYKQSSINLLVTGGLLFLLINLNIDDLYLIINKPEFTKGALVVLFISIAKIIELALGTANAILVNSKYFKIFFYLSVAMAASVVVLNVVLISKIGIDGAALATLIVVFVYSLVKIIYIKHKFDMFPFTSKSFYVFTLTVLIFLIGSYVRLPFNPIINISLKSLVILLVYSVIAYKFSLSTELNSLIKSMKKTTKN